MISEVVVSFKLDIDPLSLGHEDISSLIFKIFLIIEKVSSNLVRSR